MKRALILIPLLPLLALAACETAAPPPPPMRYRPPPPPPVISGDRFDARDFAWSERNGRNVIDGEVVLHTKKSGGFTCADGSIALTPETALSAARTLRLYGSTDHATTSVEAVRERSAGESAPAYAAYVRSTKCDAAGHFVFRDLPDGGWFLIARAKPERGDGTPVVIMRRVEARGGIVQSLGLR
jgi:hypothetical protein